QDMAKGLQGAVGGDANAKPVDPVNFHELQAAFGDVGGGWQKGKPTGERMTSPVNFSQAEVTYTKGESRIKAQISDSALNQLMLIPFSMFRAANHVKEDDNGYEKPTKRADY